MMAQRKTISVPEELRLRMKRVGTNVNWSLVACEAFEAVLSGTRVPEYQVPLVPLSADDGGEPMYIPADAWAAEALGTLTRFVDLANQYVEYDPQFQTWYRELRPAAYTVIDSLDGRRIELQRLLGAR